jgi:hypothetical protein
MESICGARSRLPTRELHRVELLAVRVCNSESAGVPQRLEIATAAVGLLGGFLPVSTRCSVPAFEHRSEACHSSHAAELRFVLVAVVGLGVGSAAQGAVGFAGRGACNACGSFYPRSSCARSLRAQERLHFSSRRPPVPSLGRASSTDRQQGVRLDRDYSQSVISTRPTLDG